VLAAVAAVSAPALAAPYSDINEAAAAKPIVVQPLPGNIRALEGSGGNIGILSGPDGLLVVDAGVVSRRKIIDALHATGPGKVRYFIDTHWHWDHTDGNGWLHHTGATVIADKQAVRRLKQKIRIVEWQRTFTPIPKAALPNRIMRPAGRYTSTARPSGSL
jgi:glyoxylase-like metal-dependent hydrolase (beta-lactamase superfamily II)